MHIKHNIIRNMNIKHNIIRSMPVRPHPRVQVTLFLRCVSEYVAALAEIVVVAGGAVAYKNMYDLS